MYGMVCGLDEVTWVGGAKISSACCFKASPEDTSQEPSSFHNHHNVAGNGSPPPLTLHVMAMSGDIESLKDCPLQTLDLSYCSKLTGEDGCAMAQGLTQRNFLGTFSVHFIIIDHHTVAGNAPPPRKHQGPPSEYYRPRPELV